MTDDPLPQTTPTTTQPEPLPRVGEGAGGEVPKWGDPISSIPIERQEQLRKLAEEQRAWLAATGPDRDPEESPLAKATTIRPPLTGTEIFFLAVESHAIKRGIELDEAARQVRDLSMPLANLHLEGADLVGAHLERASLSGSHLEDADLADAHLEGASLVRAHLKEAVFAGAHLEHSSLQEAHLEGAFLGGAHLKGAFLGEAHLEGTYLTEAHLEGAHFWLTHLEGADLSGANLAGTDLSAAFFNAATDLRDTAIADAQYGTARVADVRWQGANLAVIQQWSQIEMLGDEQEAWKLSKKPLPNPQKRSKPLPKNASREEREKAREARSDELLDAWRTAARANRQLASVMRDQGMNDEADRFAYRGQVCQRQVYRYSGQRGRRLGSWLLDATSGYGYHPRRSAFTYLGVVLAFAVAFFLLRASVTPALNPLDALVFSVTSFHGRGFSPGEAVTLHNPLTVLAAGEAILGLLIEITFIATFTQRFFGR